MLTQGADVWRPLPEWLGGEQPYDLNSWQESETALALADTLDEDAVIVEGYAEYATWRPHLAYLRDPYGDPDMEMELDGVGGVSILAKAKVFRYGVHFPAFSFEKHAETEGFGKVGWEVAIGRAGGLANFCRRWQGGWTSLLSGCLTTRFGTHTSLALTISSTWR
jgi:mannan polymerase II complex ANP1 subunit